MISGRVAAGLTSAVVMLGAVGACAGDPSADAEQPTPSSTGATPATPSVERHDRATTTGEAAVAGPAPSQVVAQRPTSIVLSSGTTVAVDSTATGPDGELEIPTDVRRAGWWDGSSRLGDPFGSVVVAAHVDSFSQGLGRFAELFSVRPGAEIWASSPGLAQRYEVRSAGLVAKSTVTAGADVFSVAGDPRLVLITCGGAYDPATGYEDNLVVVAYPVGPLEPRRG